MYFWNFTVFYKIEFHRVLFNFEESCIILISYSLLRNNAENCGC